VETLTIQPYDMVMLAVLALATLFGTWKGAVWQVASLASLVVSFLVALHFSGPLAPYISDREWNRFAAMLILYLVTSMAIWIAFRFVSGLIDRMKLREFDRQIGALFGLAKGVLLCLVITFFVVTLSEAARVSILRSPSGRAMSWLLQRSEIVMPQEVRGAVGKYLRQLDDELNRPPEVAPPRLGEPASAVTGGAPEGWVKDVFGQYRPGYGQQAAKSRSPGF